MVEVAERVPDDRAVRVVVDLVAALAVERRDHGVGDAAEVLLRPLPCFTRSCHRSLLAPSLRRAVTTAAVGEVELPGGQQTLPGERGEARRLPAGGVLEGELESDARAVDVDRHSGDVHAECADGALDATGRATGERARQAWVRGVEQAVDDRRQRQGHMVAVDVDVTVEAGRERGREREGGGDTRASDGRSRARTTRSPTNHAPVSQPSSIAAAPIVSSERSAIRGVVRRRQEMRLHLELAGDGGQGAAREVAQPEPRLEVAAVVAQPAFAVVDLDDRIRDVRQRERAHPVGQRDRPDRLVGLVDLDRPVTVRVAVGRHAGGRWIGRIRAFGLVASAVASKVGSSMVWHMWNTASSPAGSTLISAPQCSSQNSPCCSSRTE